MGGSLDEVLVVSEPGADSDDGGRDQSGRVSPEYKTDKMAICCPQCPMGRGKLRPVLEIWFGPPTADFGSIWYSQKARKF